MDVMSVLVDQTKIIASILFSKTKQGKIEDPTVLFFSLFSGRYFFSFLAKGSGYASNFCV